MGGGTARTAVFGPQDPETPVTHARLADHPPAIHRLEFVGGDQPGHVKPETVPSTSTVVPVTRDASVSDVTSDQVETLRRAAETDSRVLAMLGDRWAFIEADRFPVEGKVSFGCCVDSRRRPVKLLYFSYSQNVAVEVQMQDATIIGISRQEGYSPAEGDRDVQQAVALARADSRLSGRVGDLTGHGLLMEPARGIIWNDPGYGHRVMWVTFSHGDDGDPKFWAIVDLTADAVLDAGNEPPR